jgi:transcriptional regulator with GAF, ATPase, and Fis domain
MSEPVESSAGTRDDRCPYALVEAVIHTIIRLDPAIADEDAAWRILAPHLGSRAGGREDEEYFAAARRSHEPVFLHRQHRLYEAGSALTRSELDQFCADCGRQFMRMFSLSNIYGFLRVALAGRGALQKTIIELVRGNMRRYAGGQFVLSDEIGPEEVSLTLESTDPEEQVRYFEGHRLDPERCFRNSFYFIAGALDKIFSHVVAGYDASAAAFSVSGHQGRMAFPVKEGDLLTYETLSQAVMGYVNRLIPGRRTRPEGDDTEKDLILGSEAMRRSWEKIRRASRTNEIVLLRGESGTGKSFIARKIHELSARHDRPFVEVGLTSDIGAENMIQSDLFGHEKGAFTGAADEKQGLFSLAEGGTIFLDEIGDASGELQAKLLRVIESSTFKRLGGVRDISVDVRVIAATNRDLEKMVRDGSFRQDLYYRLNVIPIELPPLRERPEDVPTMAMYLLARANSRSGTAEKRLARGLASGFRAYPWPGNVRELDHALKHAIAMADGPEIAREDLPDTVREYMAAHEGRGRPTAGGPEAPSTKAAPDEVINVDALRRAIGSADPVSVAKSGSAHGIPGHIEHAKRIYLAALIDEFGGDLSLVAKFWDRRSVKTLRVLVKEYGLTDRLEAARTRRQGS